MRLYTFYPYTAQGASLGFEAHDLDDDASAMALGRRLIGGHRSAVEIQIWQGERLVAHIQPRDESGPASPTG